MTTDAADLLDYLFDAEYVVYVVNSKHIIINYLYTSIIITAGDRTLDGIKASILLLTQDWLVAHY